MASSLSVPTAAGQTASVGNVNYVSVADGSKFVWLIDKPPAVTGVVLTADKADAAALAAGTASKWLDAANYKTLVDAVGTILGVTLGDADLGTFTGTTIADDVTVKAALQALETRLEAFDITGRYIGSALTFATLPTSTTEIAAAVNGDWAYLRVAEIGTGTAVAPQYPKGVYLYNGTAYSYMFDFTADILPMVGATATVAGKGGTVPVPAAGDQFKVLRGDGTWGETKPWLFASSADLPGTTNGPTNAQLSTWIAAQVPPVRDRYVFWNGTVDTANGYLFTWYVDSQGVPGPLRNPSSTRIYPWLANESIGNYYVRTYTMPDGVTVLLYNNSNTGRFANSSFNSTEAGSFTLIGQNSVKDYTANMPVMVGYQIKRNNVIYQSLTNHVTQPFFSTPTEFAQWEVVSGQMLGGGAPVTIANAATTTLSNNTYVGVAGAAGSASPKLATGSAALQQWVRVWNNDGGTYTIGLQTATDKLNGVANGTVVLSKKGTYKDFYNPGGADWYDITQAGNPGSLHDFGVVPRTAIVASGTNAHLEGGGGYTLNAAILPDGFSCNVLNTTASDQTVTLTGFTDAYLRNGATIASLGTTITVPANTVYEIFSDKNGANTYCNVRPARSQIGMGAALPSAATTDLFRLIGHATLPNGIYYSDGSSWIKGA